jgi:hypothetical protein
MNVQVVDVSSVWKQADISAVFDHQDANVFL